MAPGQDDEAELNIMSTLLNSYGKTWHAWQTHRTDGQGMPGDPVPMGPALLRWSFNRDGEADGSLLQRRNRRLGSDVEAKRQARKPLLPQPQPQEGVDALAYAFPNAAAEPPEDVVDSAGARGAATPTS